MRQWLTFSVFFAVAGLCVAGLAQAQDIVINEVLYDDVSTDDEEFLELKGTPGMSLNGYTLVGVNGSGGVDYRVVDLNGQSVPDDGYFVVGMTGVLNVDLVDDNTWQNGPDKVELRLNDVEVDGVCYGFSADLVCEGDNAEDVPGGTSLARCPDGNDTNNNADDFVGDVTPTPGTENDADCSPVPTQYTLCEIAEDDADGFPVHYGELVEVSGVCISPSNIYSTYNQDIKITDGVCCLTIFESGNISPVVNVGDDVTVIGTVAFYNGLTEVSGPGLVITINSSGNPIPPPIEVTTADFALNGEDYESCLLQFKCVEIVGGSWPAEGSDANLDVDDGSGPGVMRIDRDTNIDGSPPPTGKFTVIGVGGQYDSSSPYDTGYQLMPRWLDDLDLEDPDCTPPTGACCFADGSCLVLSEDECTGQGGDLWLIGEVCDPNPCPQPLGACCLPDGSCIFVTEDECLAGGNEWLGGSCDPNPCEPVVPTVEKSWGRIKHDFRKESR